MPEAVAQTNSLSSSPAPASAPAAAPAAPAAAAPAAPASPAAAPAADAVATRPEGIPETYWDRTANALKVDPAVLATDLKERDELKAFKAADDIRRLTIPAPDKYEVKLPDDFKAPEGVTFELNKDDPLIAQLRTFANAKGLDQKSFETALGFYAATKVGEVQQFAAAKAAEVAKLGVNGTARVTAVQSFLNGIAPNHFKALNRVLEMAPVAETVEGLEALAKVWSSQGGANFSQSHRDTPDEAKIPGYETMNFEQKRYAQDQRTQRVAR